MVPSTTYRVLQGVLGTDLLGVLARHRLTLGAVAVAVTSMVPDVQLYSGRLPVPVLLLLLHVVPDYCSTGTAVYSTYLASRVEGAQESATRISHESAASGRPTLLTLLDRRFGSLCPRARLLP